MRHSVVVAVFLLICATLASTSHAATDPTMEKLAALLPAGALPPPIAVATAGSTNMCELCFYFFDLMDDLLNKNTPAPEIERTAELVCTVTGLLAPDVCNGIIIEFAPEFLYIMNTTYRNHSRDICWVLNQCGSAHSSDDRAVLSRHGWTSGLVMDELREKTSANSVPSAPPSPVVDYSDPNVGTFLQLTDLHYDENYLAGTATNCGKPTCCHSTDGVGTPPHVAGTFGAYVCDGSPALQEALMATLTTMERKPDFVLWTGDEAPDDVWMQSRESNIDSITYLADRVASALPGIKAFPSVGNHEPFPIAQLDGPASFGGDKWLYTAMGSAWSLPSGPDWLDANAKAELLLGGYYSQSIVPGRGGLRVIALNTQHGTRGNYWLLMNQTDPSGQLAWFSSTLARAASAGEKVYIIAHIPMGNEMNAAYADSIHARIEPFSDTVAGLFFGHTHMDSIQIRRDYRTGTVPTNICYVSPSITPQTNINPSFRVYAYDRTTYQVLDYVQYTADLTAANQFGVLTFNESYSARAAYNLTGLTPADWQDFINRLTVDSNLLDTYIQHHVTKGRPTNGCETDPICQRRTICDAASFTPDLYRKCMNNTRANPSLGACTDVFTTFIQSNSQN